MYFVDLRPIPMHTRPLTTDQFAVIMAHLLNSESLDGMKIREVIWDPRVGRIMGVLNRFGTYTAQPWMGDVLNKTVKDSQGVIHALKVVSIESYLMVSLVQKSLCFVKYS